jgi:hypothetical protein
LRNALVRQCLRVVVRGGFPWIANALGDAFDQCLQILCAGLKHMPKHRPPGLVDHMQTIQKQPVKVDVQVERRTEVLNQRHLSCAVVARCRMVPGAQRPGTRFTTIR